MQVVPHFPRLETSWVEMLFDAMPAHSAGGTFIIFRLTEKFPIETRRFSLCVC